MYISVRVPFVILATIFSWSFSEACILSDSRALLDFKSGLDAGRSAALSTWKRGADCCSWGGVTCSNDTGAVTEIHLGNQNLAGTVSPHLCHLASLRYLNLSFNSLITGSFPLCVWTDLTDMEILDLQSAYQVFARLPNVTAVLPKLQHLSLRGCTLSGGSRLPSWVEILPRTSLVFLDISATVVGGILPKSIGAFSQLKYLDLSSNALVGSIPVSLWSLSRLTVLSVSENQLIGSLPWGLLGKMPYLTSLSLGSNYLTGSIPSWLINLPALSYLDLSNNNLSGTIAPFFGNQTRLEVLDLSGNVLEGRIPESIGNCSSLQILRLFDNRLTGEIPATLGNLDGLGILSLEINKFSGKIPATLGNLDGLRILSLGMNKLSGKIPSALADLKALIMLDFQRNGLSGQLPSFANSARTLRVFNVALNDIEGPFPKWIPHLSALQILDLSDNKFSGILTDTVDQMKGFNLDDLVESSLLQTIYFKGGAFRFQYPLSELTLLSVAGNNFSGNIPDQWGQVAGLIILNLSRNQFSGNVPDSIGNIPNPSLEAFDFSQNYLTGEIPANLANMSHLVYADLSDNYLKGQVPQSGQFLTFSSDFFAGNPDLCGLPLKKLCSPLQIERSVDETGSWDFLSVSVPAVAVGFTIGFGLVSNAILFSKRARSAIYRPVQPQYWYNEPYGLYIPRQ